MAWAREGNPVTGNARLGALAPVRVPCVTRTLSRGSARRRPGHLRPGVRDVPLVLGEGPPDERAQPALGEPLGERVDGREPAEVNEVLLPSLDDFRVRMIYGARLQRDGLAEDNHLVSRRKILLHVGEVPPAAMQPGGAVVEDQLIN